MLHTPVFTLLIREKFDLRQLNEGSLVFEPIFYPSLRFY